ncbi:dicarboxylate/amino acid:cation symporter [Azospirillum griseum]|uniref:Dicarboxylate/amino acid:cation symporter n=1 Tax=Azospirillum griseum TaxID=2496639 RepID=A0A3S0KV54_9PROT|nr:dicarboxylate/amino acid:cation symporter [Azospirillum griseum]RTR15847.1 dicarboxylate/amino acid:cation symporter [Azospirillum griseum]
MNRQTTLIIAAMLLGILTGYLCNTLLSPADAKTVAGYFVMVTDIFLRLIKMIIAPLIFSTLVAGMAGMGDAKTVGRIGGKAVGWFLMASFASLFLGLIFANLLQPGAHVTMPLPDSSASAGLKTSSLNLKDFLIHVFPRNIFEAMATNEILQILVFSLFFGLALGQLRDTKAGLLAQAIEEVVPVMLRVTDYVMRFAPIGVFAAVANVVATQGLGVLAVYGTFMGGFYLTLAVLWLVLLTAGFAVLKGDVFRLVGLTRQPMLLAFSTASSESAYPRLMETLKRFGVSERVIGFVLPLGYSFNLDGSMIYTAFASLFIAQAYNLPLSLDQQITMLLVLMVSSKGIAGVPRSSLVVVAAVLPMFNLPEAGVLLILGIDHFLDMGRTATNVLGNAIATSVVAKWENALGTETDEDEDAADPVLASATARH